MKKYKNILFSFLLIVGNCVARNDQEQFLRANKYYENDQWDKALEGYDMIKKKGSAVWYNMGNCLYKLQKYPDALVCFKRAEKYVSHAKELHDIDGNIDAVYAKIGKAKDKTWADYFYYLLKRGAGSRSLLFFQLIFLAAWYFLWFGIKRSRRKIRLLFSVSFLVAVLVWSGITLLVGYREQKYSVGIAIKKSASVFAGPNSEYHVLAKAHCADEVTIVQMQDDWYKVRYNGVLGWMEAGDVKKV